MRSLHFGWVISCFVLGVFAYGAEPAAKPDVQPAGIKPPTLTFMDNGKQASLDLAKVHVTTIIKGYVAETTETLTFHNPLPRVLQGDLDFPLPEGATVSGFGLDVDGEMVDGVPVPREEARITFEKEVRKGVDPGLAEQTVGNTFRTRVYPIPANGDRTIKVQYVADLTDVVVGEGAVSYRLPLRWGKQIGDFSMHIEVLDAPSSPEIRGAFSYPQVKQEGDRYVADLSAQAVDFASDLVIALPNPPAQSAVIEKRITHTITIDEIEKVGFPDDPKRLQPKPEFYFAIHDQAPAPSDESRKIITPKRIGVCWDASINRANSDKTRELDLLANIIQKNNPDQVDLIVFSDKAQPAKTFAIKNGDASELVGAIKAVTYDGGMNISCLKLSKTSDELYLLFSNGLVNLGTSMPSLMESPVYPITNEPRADYALLHRIAAESGGTFFNLLRASDDQVISALVQQPYALLSIQVTGGKVADVYPKGRQVVAGRTCISGRLLSPEATLVLNYGVGSTPQKTVTYFLKQSDATGTGIVPRLWAQMKLADLLTDPDANADAITSLGQDFNLVTPNTSLLVLETLQQYLTYRIVPPKMRAEIYKQFMAQIQQQASAKLQTREERIQQVQQMWTERAKWWEAEYKYDKNFKYNEPVAATGGMAGGITGGGTFAGGASTRPGGTGGGSRTIDGHPTMDTEARRSEPLPLVSAAHVPAATGHDLAANDSVLLQTDDNDGASTPDAGWGGGRASKDGTGRRNDSSPAISIKPWDPNTPYLTAMKSVAADQAYVVYLQQRKDFAAAPAFYLDCADFLLNHDQRDAGVRVLTDIPALKLESPELLRIAAYRLRQIGEYDLAIDLFEKTLQMRPEEPQSYRDLALALADRAGSLGVGDSQSQDHAAADYSRALDLLYQVVLRQPDQRFPGLEVIAMEEANQILAQAEPLMRVHAIANPIDPRLLKLMDLDVRVVMSWDTADTDIDLWVTEPSGEKCMYSHNRTTIGGMLSNDFTQGYGPEEYNLRRAMPGKYIIQANFYGSRSQAITGPTTVHAMVITHWGRPDEKRQSLTVRLTDNKEVVDLGTVTVEP